MDDQVKCEVLQNGFRKCVLYPWDACAVDYSKTEKDKCTVNQWKETQLSRTLFPTEKRLDVKNGLEVLEHFIGDENLKTCYEWIGQEKDLSLIKIWKQMTNEQIRINLLVPINTAEFHESESIEEFFVQDANENHADDTN